MPGNRIDCPSQSGFSTACSTRLHLTKTYTLTGQGDSFATDLRALLKAQRCQEAGQKPYRVRMSWAWYAGKCGYGTARCR